MIKLEYDIGKKLVFIDAAKVALTENDLSLIMSFLLDATEEYMSYDHNDLELLSEDQAVDVCIRINQ